MAGLTARSGATRSEEHSRLHGLPKGAPRYRLGSKADKPSGGANWGVTGTAAAVIHVLAFYLGLGLSQPAVDAGRSSPTEVTLETVVETQERADVQSLEPVGDATASSAPRAVDPRKPAGKTVVKRTADSSRSQSPAPDVNGSPAALGTATAALHSTAGNAPTELAASSAATATTLKSSSTLASAGTLSTKPRLLSSGAACQGVLHSSALSAPTKVTLVLHVDKHGNASPTAVQAESKAKVPGLEVAAQRCAQRLRFAPAHAQDGSLVAASSVVKLTFSNHYTATLPHSTKSRHGAI